jgi:hypothetical protein
MLLRILTRCTDYVRAEYIQRERLIRWDNATRELDDVELEEYLRFLIAYEHIKRIEDLELSIKSSGL